MILILNGQIFILLICAKRIKDILDWHAAVCFSFFGGQFINGSRWIENLNNYLSLTLFNCILQLNRCFFFQEYSSPQFSDRGIR